MANFEYRVTKYNPNYRHVKGHFLKEEWTSFDDIGRVFDGEMLTLEKYKNVESAYLQTAMAFLHESGEATL